MVIASLMAVRAIPFIHVLSAPETVWLYSMDRWDTMPLQRLSYGPVCAVNSVGSASEVTSVA